MRQWGQQDCPLNALQSILRQQLVSLYWQGQDDMPTRWGWLCLEITAGSWSAHNTILSLCNCLPDIQPLANSNGISVKKGATIWLHMAVQIFVKVELGRAIASFSIEMICQWNSCQLCFGSISWGTVWKLWYCQQVYTMLKECLHRNYCIQQFVIASLHKVTATYAWTTVINNIDRAKHLTFTATV